MTKGLVRSLLVVAVFITMTAAAERVLYEGIMVRVNDRVVTISEFAERLRQEITQMPEDAIRGKEREFAQTMLSEMVAELVISERASQKQVLVDDATVDRAIEGIREDNNLQDDAAWQQALASSGLTIEQLRERYRKNILLQRTVQSEVRPIEITEEELRLDYEAHKERYLFPAKIELEQVFLSDANGSQAQNMQTARGLVERVRGGADLKAEATLAGAELQSLGAIPVEDCRQDLRQAIEGLDDGGLTEPLAVPGGVQVIRLVRHIPAGYQPFEEVAEQLRREKSESSYEEQTRGLVEKLKSEYLVEVHDDYLDVVYQMLGGV